MSAAGASSSFWSSLTSPVLSGTTQTTAYIVKMNATKSSTAKYEQYLDNPVKQIENPSSQTHWVLPFNTWYSFISRTRSFCAAQSLVSIFSFRDHVRVVLRSFGDYLESWDLIGRRTKPVMSIRWQADEYFLG